MTNNQKLKMVVVWWRDSATPSSNNWVKMDDLDANYTTAPCVTMGFLVRETSKEILLAQTRNLGDTEIKILSCLSIPKGCIIKRRVMGRA